MATLFILGHNSDNMCATCSYSWVTWLDPNLDGLVTFIMSDAQFNFVPVHVQLYVHTNTVTAGVCLFPNQFKLRQMCQCLFWIALRTSLHIKEVHLAIQKRYLFVSLSENWCRNWHIMVFTGMYCTVSTGSISPPLYKKINVLMSFFNIQMHFLYI